MKKLYLKMEIIINLIIKIFKNVIDFIETVKNNDEYLWYLHN